MKSAERSLIEANSTPFLASILLQPASSATQVYSAAGSGHSSNRPNDAGGRLDGSAHWFFFAVQLTGGRPILASSCLNAGSP
jgi:hypothetical protein